MTHDDTALLLGLFFALIALKMVVVAVILWFGFRAEPRKHDGDELLPVPVPVPRPPWRPRRPARPRRSVRGAASRRPARLAR